MGNNEEKAFRWSHLLAWQLPRLGLPDQCLGNPLRNDLGWSVHFVLHNSFNTLFRISWDLQQLSLSECVTHFLLRFWPSAQFAIAPKPFKVEVWALVFFFWNLVKLQQVGEQQRYGGSLAVEQCNNYTWVLTAVAEGGKSTDVQGDQLCSQGVW